MTLLTPSGLARRRFLAKSEHITAPTAAADMLGNVAVAVQTGQAVFRIERRVRIVGERRKLARMADPAKPTGRHVGGLLGLGRGRQHHPSREHGPNDNPKGGQPHDAQHRDGLDR